MRGWTPAEVKIMGDSKVPQGLEFWTADTVAECLSYSKFLPDDYPGGWTTLYSKLWSFLSTAQSPTPLGGDGTDGTVETPDGRLDLRNDDKASHWWKRLTDVEQAAIRAAYAAECGV